jgi:tRNA splicing ligase
MFILKKILSRASWPISIKLDANHPRVKGILNCTNKEPGPFQRGDNHKNAN